MPCLAWCLPWHQRRVFQSIANVWIRLLRSRLYEIYRYSVLTGYLPKFTYCTRGTDCVSCQWAPCASTDVYRQDTWHKYVGYVFCTFVIKTVQWYPKAELGKNENIHLEHLWLPRNIIKLHYLYAVSVEYRASSLTVHDTSKPLQPTIIG